MFRSIAKTVIPAKALEQIRRFRASGPVIAPLVDRYCTGNGIEIGAGKRPYGPAGRTLFLDRHTANADGTPNPDIVTDANTIPRPDESFDFLVSSHVLEHMPNTIRTLEEWRRVLKRGGILFLVLPHGDRTFDRLREKTTLEHHVADYDTGVEAPDRTHIEEISQAWRPLISAADEQVHRERWGWDCWDWEHRFANDAVHYHVWTQDEIVRLLQYLGLTIIYVNEMATERDDSFVTVARKP